MTEFTVLVSDRLGEWIDAGRVEETQFQAHGFVAAVDEAARSVLPRENRAFALDLGAGTDDMSPPLALPEEVLLLARRTVKDTAVLVEDTFDGEARMYATSMRRSRLCACACGAHVCVCCVLCVVGVGVGVWVLPVDGGDPLSAQHPWCGFGGAVHRVRIPARSMERCPSRTGQNQRRAALCHRKRRGLDRPSNHRPC